MTGVGWWRMAEIDVPQQVYFCGHSAADQRKEHVSGCWSVGQWLTVDLGSGVVPALMLRAANTVEYRFLLQ